MRALAATLAVVGLNVGAFVAPALAGAGAALLIAATGAALVRELAAG